ncbi:MAG: DNA repair and recombination protein RadA [Candidatus Micrarchaeota archaeon]|nr:DNA repair and recombination protein RadA [Candidatus Micrarchaeota archaeon]
MAKLNDPTVPKELEDLPGVGEAIAEKLRAAGYGEINSIAAAIPAELAEVADISIDAATKIIAKAKDSITLEYSTGWDILERRKDIGRITTGSKNLDDLLGGGVETQAITEFYGKFSSGKSQVGFQLSVNVQRPIDKGGLGGKAVFIDTEGTFRPDRIKQMAEGAKMDSREVLNNILVMRAENSDHQVLIVDKLENIIAQENVRLIVIDSLTSHFRADYIGRGALSERQQRLNRHIHLLQKLSDRFNLAVYFTNQVMDNPGILFGDPTVPIGGHVIAHAATYRVYLRKGKETKRIARMVDSPNLPEGEAIFRVTPEGIDD